MAHASEWRFPFGSIEEAVMRLRYKPKRSGQYLINEPDLVCIAYTNRNTTSEYTDLVAGKPREKYFPAGCAEVALYFDSNPTADAEVATIRTYSILVSYFAVRGGVQNFWLESKLVGSGSRLEYSEELKVRVIELVRKSFGDLGTGLVLVVPVKRPFV